LENREIDEGRECWIGFAAVFFFQYNADYGRKLLPCNNQNLTEIFVEKKPWDFKVFVLAVYIFAYPLK